jgi:rfaE bifunctional protein nucleotidyltransferase chain/domain
MYFKIFGKFLKMKIIFTNGCFDILHRGHIDLLRYCKSLGGKVIVGLNSDKSVKKLKGDQRPINSQEDRKFLLESIKYVDKVFIFSNNTPYELIKKIKPDIIVKGGDYLPNEVVGKDIAKVRIFNYVKGYSTSETIKRISDR